jgi:hypothetical protein
MEQRQGQAPVSDPAAKVGDIADDLAGRSKKLVQDKMDQAKPVLRDLQESAGAAMDKVADLAQNASTAGVQAADAIQHVARDVGNQVGQAATSAYQQGARASRIRQSIRCRTAADGAVRCRRNRVRGRLPNPPVLGASGRSRTKNL